MPMYVSHATPLWFTFMVIVFAEGIIINRYIFRDHVNLHHTYSYLAHYIIVILLSPPLARTVIWVFSTWLFLHTSCHFLSSPLLCFHVFPHYIKNIQMTALQSSSITYACCIIASTMALSLLRFSSAFVSHSACYVGVRDMHISFAHFLSCHTSIDGANRVHTWLAFIFHASVYISSSSFRLHRALCLYSGVRRCNIYSFMPEEFPELFTYYEFYILFV